MVKASTHWRRGLAKSRDCPKIRRREAPWWSRVVLRCRSARQGASCSMSSTTATVVGDGTWGADDRQGPPIGHPVRLASASSTDLQNSRTASVISC